MKDKLQLLKYNDQEQNKAPTKMAILFSTVYTVAYLLDSGLAYRMDGLLGSLPA